MKVLERMADLVLRRGCGSSLEAFRKSPRYLELLAKRQSERAAYGVRTSPHWHYRAHTVKSKDGADGRVDRREQWLHDVELLAPPAETVALVEGLGEFALQCCSDHLRKTPVGTLLSPKCGVSIYETSLRLWAYLRSIDADRGTHELQLISEPLDAALPLRMSLEPGGGKRAASQPNCLGRAMLVAAFFKERGIPALIARRIERIEYLGVECLKRCAHEVQAVLANHPTLLSERAQSYYLNLSDQTSEPPTPLNFHHLLVVSQTGIPYAGMMGWEVVDGYGDLIALPYTEDAELDDDSWTISASRIAKRVAVISDYCPGVSLPFNNRWFYEQVIDEILAYHETRIIPELINAANGRPLSAPLETFTAQMETLGLSIRCALDGEPVEALLRAFYHGARRELFGNGTVSPESGFEISAPELTIGAELLLHAAYTRGCSNEVEVALREVWCNQQQLVYQATQSHREPQRRGTNRPAQEKSGHRTATSAQFATALLRSQEVLLPTAQLLICEEMAHVKQRA